jgi:hypothetical protein
MNRAKQRRLEKLKQKAERRQPGQARPIVSGYRNLTEEQEGILESFNALDAKIKALRVTVPTGAKVARAFGALAEAMDFAMQEVAKLDGKLELVAEDKPGFEDVTNQVSDDTLAVAGVERKPDTVQ